MNSGYSKENKEIIANKPFGPIELLDVEDKSQEGIKREILKSLGFGNNQLEYFFELPSTFSRKIDPNFIENAVDETAKYIKDTQDEAKKESLKFTLEQFKTRVRDVAFENIFSDIPVPMHTREMLIRISNFIEDTLYFSPPFDKNGLETFMQNQAFLGIRESQGSINIEYSYRNILTIVKLLSKYVSDLAPEDTEKLVRAKSIKSLINTSSRNATTERQSSIDMFGVRLYFKNIEHLEDFVQRWKVNKFNIICNGYYVNPETYQAINVFNERHNIKDGDVTLMQTSIKILQNLGANASYLGANLSTVLSLTDGNQNNLPIPISLQLCLSQFSAGDWYEHTLYKAF